jgi:multisubunit Na+/H+ antiporter MnhB subunit
VFIAKIIPNINFVSVLVISAAGVIIFYLLFYNYPSVGVHRHPTTKKANLTRFFISGFVVAMSGISAKFLGPTWGGLVASFPVTVAVGLYFLDKSQSDNFTKSFVKELPLAIVSTLIFVSILYITLLKVNTVSSFSISIIAAYVYAFIHTKLRRKIFRKTAKISA